MNTPHTRAIDDLCLVETQLASLETELAPAAAKLQTNPDVALHNRKRVSCKTDLTVLRKVTTPLSDWAQICDGDLDIPTLAKMPDVDTGFVLNQLGSRKEERRAADESCSMAVTQINEEDDSAASTVARTRDEVDVRRTKVQKQRALVEGRKRDGVVAEESHGEKESKRNKIMVETNSKKRNLANLEVQNEEEAEAMANEEEEIRAMVAKMEQQKYLAEQDRIAMEDSSEFSAQEREEYRLQLENDLKFASKKNRDCERKLLKEIRIERAPCLLE